MLSILVGLSLSVPLAPAPRPPELRGEALMAALREGGYTILVRHARTDRSIPNQERPDYTPPLRADQRNLTTDGERDVRLMAAVVRKYELPIGEVLSSPLYRCRETADAFGTPTLTMTLRTFPTTGETAALVAAAPKPGTNRVLVTHHFVIENYVPGIRPGDIGESEAVVIRPDGNGGIAVVGRILLADWTELAGPADTRGAPAAQDVPPTMLHASAAGVSAAGAAPTVPDSRVGRLALRYIEAFNSGDPQRMRAFTESSMVAVPDRPTEARVQTYVGLFEEYGPLTTHGVAAATEESVDVRVSSRHGDLIVRVTAAPQPSDRAQSVSFLIMSGGAHR